MAWVSDRRTFLAAGMVSLVVALTGCGGGGGGGGDTGGNTVTGTIVNSADQDTPVGGATVTIGTATGTTLTVDQAPGVGTFTLRNVPTGANTITVTFQNTRPNGDNGGVETFTDTQTLQFEPAITSGTNNLGELYVNIGQVAGQVLLPSGQPVEGAYVTITSIGVTVQTGADGRFFETLVPTGNTDISVVYATTVDSRNLVYTALRTVTINNGVTNVGTLQLAEDTNPNPPGQPSTIIGKVLLSDGASAEGSTVILLRNGVQVEQTVASASGTYGFYVPVGSYSVRVLRDGYLEGNTSGQVSNPNVQLSMPDITLTPRT